MLHRGTMPRRGDHHPDGRVPRGPATVVGRRLAGALAGLGLLSGCALLDATGIGEPLNPSPIIALETDADGTRTVLLQLCSTFVSELRVETGVELRSNSQSDHARIFEPTERQSGIIEILWDEDTPGFQERDRGDGLDAESLPLVLVLYTGREHTWTSHNIYDGWPPPGYVVSKGPSGAAYFGSRAEWEEPFHEYCEK